VRILSRQQKKHTTTKKKKFTNNNNNDDDGGVVVIVVCYCVCVGVYISNVFITREENEEKKKI